MENDMSESIFIDKLPKKDFGPGEGWEKTSLSKKWIKGDLIGLTDKRGEILVKWKEKDLQTQNNLARILKGQDAVWHVRWFRTENDLRYAQEILDETQYAVFTKAKWQNRKLMKHGYQTGNVWTA